jgi:RND family efflux transporter MFP subunit
MIDRRHRVPIVLCAVTATLLVVSLLLLRHASAQTNHVALASSPKGVTVQRAQAAKFRAKRRYVGTLEPWVEAKIGPELVSAYVSTVLVRPGARVKVGQVLATLDCRNSSTASQVAALEARAVEDRQHALERETERFQSLLDGGFAAENDVEQREASTKAAASQLAALNAQLAGKGLEVDDCVLRAPFTGEVAQRSADPGAYMRPGSTVVTLVDRQLLRLVADAPETDFAAVDSGTRVHVSLLSTGATLEGAIARRSPAADASTRTVHFEIDIAPEGRDLPVGTTAEIELEVGEPVDAVRVPSTAANVQAETATLFVVDGGKAQKVTAHVLGESGGDLYLSSGVSAGSLIVTEGRAQLLAGDRVLAKLEEGRTP